MRGSTSVIFGTYLVLLRQTLAADFSPLLIARQASGACGSTSKVCGTGCIDNSWTCCPDKTGGCPSTQNCVLGSNGHYGCCPSGETCTGSGGVITSVAIPSGTIISSASSGLISSYPVGQPFTTGGSIGVVGTDGTVRYCSTGSYLCPASVNYGCCPNGDGCGLTNCPILGSMTASPTATTTVTSLSSVVAITSASSATAGQVISDGASIGTVGTDGTTRYCTTGSYLCAASYNYGCCPNTDDCGLTNCPHRSTLASGPGTGTSPITATTTTSLTSNNIGATITSSTAVGIVGTDGTTRFCTTGSSLCPASLNYGCCKNGYECGLTDCTPTASGSLIYPSSTSDGSEGQGGGGDDVSQSAFFNTLETGNVFTDSSKPIVGAATTTPTSTQSTTPARSNAVTVVGSSVLYSIGAFFGLIAVLAFGL